MTVEQLLNVVTSWAVSIASRLLLAGLMLFIGFRIVKIILKIMDKNRGLSKIDPSVRSFARNSASIGMKVMVLITAASILGLNMASFITILGTVGVAVGLSLQGSLSNIAGGLIILIFKPFKIGDFITVAGSSGTVKEIGIFYTHLSTADNSKVVIPNSLVSNETLINATEQKERRIDITVTVSYDSDIQKVKDILLNIANSHPDVLQEPAPPLARVLSHGPNSLEFTFRVWCKSENFWNVKFDLLESVKAEFDANGVSIPYPQLDVHLDNKDVK